MESNWKRYFLPHILERGKKCLREGRVGEIRRTTHGYEAIVRGEQKYHVKIDIQGQFIEQMSCDCFYVQNKGQYCKHMAAVLYELEERQMIWEKERTNHLEELNELLEESSKEELQRFLMKIATDSSIFERELRMFLTGQASKKEWMRIQNEINGMFLKYSDEYGFINFKNTGLFCEDMRVLLQEKIDRMIVYENRREAFELLSYIWDKICITESGDSEKLICILAEECFSRLGRILEQEKEQKLKTDIYEWLQKHLSEGTVNLMTEKMYDFLLECFQEIIFLEKKLKLLDKKIEKDEDAEDEWMKRKHGRDLAQRLQIMMQLSYPEEECTKYKLKFWNIPEIRQMDIQKQLQEHKYEAAEQLICESIQMDKMQNDCQEKYCRLLADLYQQQGRKKEYLDQMILYFIRYHQESVEIWRKIRSTVKQEDAEKWEEIRDEILKDVNLPYFRYKIMAEEKMYAQLMEELKQEKHLEILDQYEKILHRKFPEKMLRLYADCLLSAVSDMTGREKYRDLAAHLKKMKKYPGGSEIAGQIIENWKKRYNKRTALIEELEKIERIK